MSQSLSLRNIIKKENNKLRRVSDSVQHINTISHSSSINASLSPISITYIILNGQVIVTKPHDYTEEGHTNFERISYSVQYIDTTSHSNSIGESLSAIVRTDMNIHG